MLLRALIAFGFAALLFGESLQAQEGKYVKFVQFETGKVLTVEGNSTEALARLVAAKDDGSQFQQWKLEKDGDYYKVTNRKSGKVADVENDSEDDGASIIQWDDKSEGNDNQRWTKEGKGDYVRLKVKHSGLMLDLDKEGKAVQKKVDEKAKSQLWKIVVIDKE